MKQRLVVAIKLVLLCSKNWDLSRFALNLTILPTFPQLCLFLVLVINFFPQKFNGKESDDGNSISRGFMHLH